MPIKVPEIDDRSYDEIVAEALARIPVHNPEWTNFNDSDPGVTMVQLFAFMTESLLYRSSIIPERNRIKFLKLMGIPLQPATAAQGIVGFSNLKGPLRTETLSNDLLLFAGQVPFRTLDGLDVLPIEARIYYKAELDRPQDQIDRIKALYSELYASYTDENASLDYYETKPLDPPVSGGEYPFVNLNTTKDNALWVALLARTDKVLEETRKVIANKVLTLGILPALTEAERVLQPGGPASSEGQLNLSFRIPNADTPPAQLRNGIANYLPLDARPSGDLLASPGVVELPLPGVDQLQLWPALDPTEEGVGNLPPTLDDPAIQDRLITWIRIRLPDGQDEEDEEINTQLSGILSWVGINCARVTQNIHVYAEKVGVGSGEPDQVFTLVNTPVIKGSVKLEVNGQVWEEAEDLLTADSEVPVRQARDIPGVPAPPADPKKARVFTIDRESGEIRFGDGLHGARPPRGSNIRAGYDYGGGRQGVVGINAINKGANLPSGIKVGNALPTWGGDEPESVQKGEKLIPTYVKHRDRLVSKEDFMEVTWRAPGVDLGRVEILPLFHPQLRNVLSQGVVTVMVIPSNDQLHPETPEPDPLFLDTVCAHLDPRRIVTTEVHVRGPEYIDIWLSLGIDVVPGENVAPVRQAVKERLREFLSPLKGGFVEKGWPLEKAVEALEVWAAATRVPGVAKVNEVLLDSDGEKEDGRAIMRGLQLPRLAGLEVLAGDALPLEQLKGQTTLPDGTDGIDGTDGTAAARTVPVPVADPVC